MRYWAKFLPLFFSVIFLIITALSYENKVFFVHFVDEEDNIILGNYLLKGEKLYSDLFSQHQPLAYITSAGIQKITNPNSLYLLIKRHREFIILYSTVWSLLLVWLFGWPFFLFITIYELLKFYLFGSLFLSETLIVYPLLYLVVRIFFSKRNFTRLELLFSGFCSGTAIFLLAPAWPLVAVTCFYLFYQLRQQKIKDIFFFILGVLPVILIFLKFASLEKYFYYAFYVNYKYYIPVGNQDPFLISFIKSTLAPITSFVSGETGPVIWITRFLSFSLILNLSLLIKAKRYKSAAVFFIVLTLINLRYITPGRAFYQGFHLLPWVAVLIIVVIFSTQEVIKNISRGLFRTTAVFLVAVAILGSFYLSINDTNNLFQKRDLAKDQYINYSRQFDFGQAIRILKGKDDRLFIIPDEWLLYWQADIKHASYMVNYYAWMPSVPGIKTDVENMFKTNPPEFLYCESCDEKSLMQYSNYQVVKKEKNNTKLYILKSKAREVSEDQIKRLEFLNFSLE